MSRHRIRAFSSSIPNDSSTTPFRAINPNGGSDTISLPRSGSSGTQYSNAAGPIRRPRARSTSKSFDALFSKLSLQQLLELEANVQRILVNSNGDAKSSAAGPRHPRAIDAKQFSLSPASSFTEISSTEINSNNGGSPDTLHMDFNFPDAAALQPTTDDLSEFLELASMDEQEPYVK